MKANFKPIILSCALGISNSTALAATVQQLKVEADGHTWTYHLHVPPQAISGGAPLVLVFMVQAAMERTTSPKMDGPP